MKKVDWLAAASKLCKDLASRGAKQVSASEAKAYKTLRGGILNDKHHAPEDATGKDLLGDAQGWMTAVKKGTYDKKFTD